MMLICMSRQEAGGGGGGNRDAALLLLLHPVHGGGAFMDFADLVRTARVIQDALRGCGFTGIDMCGDADISHPLERYSACHKTENFPLLLMLHRCLPTYQR